MFRGSTVELKGMGFEAFCIEAREENIQKKCNY